MGRYRIKNLLWVAICLFLLGGCGKCEEAPVTLLEFNAFHIKDSDDTVFYIDWKNNSDDKMIDSLMLSVSCQSSNESIRYRILEPEDIGPDDYNKTRAFTIGKSELSVAEADTLEIGVLQVNFTDGTVWESDENLTTLLADVEDKAESELLQQLESQRESGGKAENTETENMMEAAESEEPEGVKRLREYYNINYADKMAKVFFVDMSGDDEVEMLVLEKTWENDEDSVSEQLFYHLTVFKYGSNSINKAENLKVSFDVGKTVGNDYYLFVNEQEAYILVKFWNVDSIDRSYAKIFFRNPEDETMETEILSREDFEEQCRQSILLIGTSVDIYDLWVTDEKNELTSYQSVLGNEEELKEAAEISANAGQSVLEYANVYDGDSKCLFAVVGEIGDKVVQSYDYENRYRGPISIWASHDEQIEKVESIDLGEMTGYLWKSEIFQYGKAQHFYVETYGMVAACGKAQHKFCYEERNVREIDHSLWFEKDEKGEASTCHISAG